MNRSVQTHLLHFAAPPATLCCRAVAWLSCALWAAVGDSSSQRTDVITRSLQRESGVLQLYWSCFTLLKEDISNCNVFKNELHHCGDTTDLHKHWKKRWQEEEGNPRHKDRGEQRSLYFGRLIKYRLYYIRSNIQPIERCHRNEIFLWNWNKNGKGNIILSKSKNIIFMTYFCLQILQGFKHAIKQLAVKSKNH